MSRQFREIVPRREQEPQRDFWLRTVMRRTVNPCRAASSSTRGGNSRVASWRRWPSMAGRKSVAGSETRTDSPPKRTVSAFFVGSSSLAEPKRRREGWSSIFDFGDKEDYNKNPANDAVM